MQRNSLQRMPFAHYQGAISNALTPSVGSYVDTCIAVSATTMQMVTYASTFMLYAFTSMLSVIPQEAQATLCHLHTHLLRLKKRI